MVQELHTSTKTWKKARRIQNFSKWPGGTGKSHVVCLIQRDMSHFFKCTVKPDDDQPIVLITAPTESAAFQISGSAIHSAFLLYDNLKSKPSWEKRTQMQLKLEHMMSITDEISMVGFKQFQSMNQTMCTLKGTTDGNWGDICVLAVGVYISCNLLVSAQYTCPHRLCALSMILFLMDGRRCSYMN